MCLLIASDSFRFERTFVYVGFNTQNVKIVVEKQTRMHLSVINLKIKIIHDLQDFVLSLTPKNENLEITEILQERHNTEI